MILGRIVSSTSHIDYTCHVYAATETPEPPGPEDHAFGRLVRLPAGPRWMVGVVADTQLMNPFFGSMGPRLSPEEDLRVFTPDYLNERITYVTITALGSFLPPASVDVSAARLSGAAERWPASHEVCPVAPALQADVLAMTDDEVRSFHLPDGRFAMGYLFRLLAGGRPTATDLALQLIAQLEAVCPENTAALGVLRDHVISTMRLGGRR